MRYVSLFAALAMVAASATASAAEPRVLAEDWTHVPAGPWPERTALGEWYLAYAGFGSATVVRDPPGLVLSPAAATVAAETHAALVTSTATFANVEITASVETQHQLRTGAANPWEVGWLIWHYRDDTHFYYVAVKPNGWELGKRTGTDVGHQRFLLSGPAPAFPLGMHELHVLQTGPTIVVACDGMLLGTFVDRDDPYLDGHVGLYTEDAAVRFGALRVQPLP